MPSGGARPGAGRKIDPNSKRQRQLAAKAAKAPAAPQQVEQGQPALQPETEPAPAADPNLTPLDYLLAVVRDPRADVRVRIQAASIAAPFVHAKKGESAAGKKAEAANAARGVAGGGRFAAAAPPKLAVVGGRKS